MSGASTSRSGKLGRRQTWNAGHPKTALGMFVTARPVGLLPWYVLDHGPCKLTHVVGEEVEHKPNLKCTGLLGNWGDRCCIQDAADD